MSNRRGGGGGVYPIGGDEAEGSLLGWKGMYEIMVVGVFWDYTGKYV